MCDCVWLCLTVCDCLCVSVCSIHTCLVDARESYKCTSEYMNKYHRTTQQRNIFPELCSFCEVVLAIFNNCFVSVCITINNLMYADKTQLSTSKWTQTCLLFTKLLNITSFKYFNIRCRITSHYILSFIRSALVRPTAVQNVIDARNLLIKIWQKFHTFVKIFCTRMYTFLELSV